jgi:hypothetical protein
MLAWSWLDASETIAYRDHPKRVVPLLFWGLRLRETAKRAAAEATALRVDCGLG